MRTFRNKNYTKFFCIKIKTLNLLVEAKKIPHFSFIDALILHFYTEEDLYVSLRKVAKKPLFSP